MGDRVRGGGGHGATHEPETESALKRRRAPGWAPNAFLPNMLRNLVHSVAPVMSTPESFIVLWMPLKYRTVRTLSSSVASSSHTAGRPRHQARRAATAAARS